MKNQQLTPDSTAPPEPVTGKDTGKDNAPELTRDELVLLLRSTLRQCSTLAAENSALVSHLDAARRREQSASDQACFYHDQIEFVQRALHADETGLIDEYDGLTACQIAARMINAVSKRRSQEIPK
jgi:hypothetical protein